MVAHRGAWNAFWKGLELATSGDRLENGFRTAKFEAQNSRLRVQLLHFDIAAKVATPTGPNEVGFQLDEAVVSGSSNDMRSAADWLPLLSDAWRAFMAEAADQPALLERIAEQMSRALDAVVDIALLQGDSSWTERRLVRDRAPAAAGLLVDELLWTQPAIISALDAGRPFLLEPSTAGDVVPTEFGAIAFWPLVTTTRPLGVVTALRPRCSSLLTTSEVQLGMYLADRAAIALEHGRALAHTGQALLERERLTERLRALAHASSAFSAATSDYKSLLTVVARTVGELLGDLCSIRLVSDDGQWLLADDASIYHRDPRIADAFRVAMESTPQRVGEGFGGAVVSSGKALVLNVPKGESVASKTLPSYRPLVELFDPGSMIILPLTSHGTCIGVLSLSRARDSQPYDDDDVRLAQDLADRAALAFENATLLLALEERVKELGRAEEKFRQLLELAPDAIVICDANGTMVIVNGQAEQLFGHARAELLGQSFEMLVPEAERARAAELRLSTLEPGPSVFELRALRKNGSNFPAEIKLGPIQTNDGRLVTAVIRDLSEKERLEQARVRTLELEAENRRSLQASRLKSEFLANMSHELRTPLNAIIGFSSLLHAGKAGRLDETQKEYLGDILSSSRHLLQLINDVLDVAKIEAGRIEISAEPVDLARLVAEARDILRGLALEKRIRITVDVSSELPPVVTDPRLLKQVLYNFLSNAIKFTPADGAIVIRLHPLEGGDFAIRVEDNGIGVKAHDMGRLFQEFQQIDSGLNKSYPGTGLGLALTKRIVEAQGGRVRAESEWGRGSVFIAELPCSPRAPEHRHAS